MTSHWQCLLVLLMTWQVVDGEDKVCIQCATPSIRENWAATGLPKQPSGLKFDKLCSIPGADQIEDKSWLSANCASSCFELLIPIDGVYNFVRGCHAEFVWQDMQVTVTNDSVLCELNKLDGYSTIGFLNKDESATTAYAGISFITPPLATAGIANFNTKLTDALITANGVIGCNSGTQRTCKSCGEYDGTGSCSASTTGTCKGVYCTKTSGKLNGHFYESRGCASFNPFAKDVCSWTDQTFNVSTGVDTAVVSARSKRAVELSFQANQCFCQGELCNSVPAVSSLILSIITASFLVFS